MRVGLLSKKIGKEAGITHGISRYCRNLVKYLEKSGIEVVSSFGSARGRYSVFYSLIHDLLLNPIFITKYYGKVDLYHAIFPSQAFFFPFLDSGTVVTFHDTSAYEHLERGLTNALWSVYERICYKLAKSSKQIIAKSEKTKNELISRLKVPDDKITVIIDGIEEKFRPIRKKERDFKTIGYVGDVSKGVDYLLRVFYLLKKKYGYLRCKLVICGKDGHYKKLIKLSEELKLTDVEFKGFIPEDKLVETYNSFDVLVFPSRYEGLGLPILEAQRCGLPVFVREDASIPEEVSRVAIKAQNEYDMADKIYMVLTDEGLYRRLSDRGIKYTERFTWDSCVKKHIEVYEKAMRK